MLPSYKPKSIITGRGHGELSLNESLKEAGTVLHIWSRNTGRLWSSHCWSRFVFSDKKCRYLRPVNFQDGISWKEEGGFHWSEKIYKLNEYFRYNNNNNIKNKLNWLALIQTLNPRSHRRAREILVLGGLILRTRPLTYSQSREVETMEVGVRTWQSSSITSKHQINLR